MAHPPPPKYVTLTCPHMWSSPKAAIPDLITYDRRLWGATKKISSEMKLARGASGRIEPRKLAGVAVAACLLLPCIFLAILKPNFSSFPFWNLQLTIRTTVQLAHVEAVREDANGSSPKQSGFEMRAMPLGLKIETGENPSSNQFNARTNLKPFLMGKEEEKLELGTKMIRLLDSYKEMQSGSDPTVVGSEMKTMPLALKEETGENRSSNPFNTSTKMKPSSLGKGENKSEWGSFPHSEEKQRRNNSNAGNQGIQFFHVLEENTKPKNLVPRNLVSESKLWCDLSQERSDTCFMHGDVRIHGPSFSLILALPSQLDDSFQNQTWKIRPYARKWESPVMETINELTLKSSKKLEELPHCIVNHNIPAVIFSTGGFLGNFFHDFTDVLIPLFITSRQYKGEVQFLATNFNSKWTNKYRSILNQLSRYEIINLDQDDRVHCFSQARVGLLSHKVLGIDPSKTPKGYSMSDFKEMLRTSYSLKRKIVRTSNKRPRLLILQRKKSRSLMNKREVVGLGRRLGFKVITAGPEETKNLSSFVRVVNSCDVMMGVHGAGLTNMLFLPMGATVIQIVPWGGLKWACWHDFGEPAPDMEVRYLDYEIKEEESSLIQQYPRNHLVFTDPLSIQRQGWNTLWSVFLDKQNVKLDVQRFKPLLLEAYQSQLRELKKKLD